MITIRSWAVYGMLAAIWAALLGWQAAEHVRVSKALHDNLEHRGHSRLAACGQLMRARGFTGGVLISKERLEAALNALLVTNELLSIEVLNRAGEVVASAGPPPPTNDFPGAVFWGGGVAILKDPIDLGTNMMQELIMPWEEWRALRASNRPPREPPGDTNRPPQPPGDGSRPPRRLNMRSERPSWMTEEHYKEQLEKAGAHTFVAVLPAQPVLDAENADIWIRLIIVLVGTLGIAGYAVAWRSLVQTSDLQLRLVRASEQNLHLKELNLAAAGLAHETRNPLNIIRGLAQMIAKHDKTPPDISAKSRDIINETDRVTAQLNEFINYSRPREVRRAATDLNAVAGEVARALNYDLEEKKIKLEVLVEPVIIEADEQLLRQALFNLVLNAIQAVPAQGAIRIRASRRSNQEAFIEISDNGPGVPAENRTEIFKPYFTTHTEGTGLGLSVVQQIVLAHGWEIQCLPNEPAGALFRVSHVKIKE